MHKGIILFTDRIIYLIHLIKVIMEYKVDHTIRLMASLKALGEANIYVFSPFDTGDNMFSLEANG